MSKVDLHIHSKFSDDGEFTPEEIVDMAVSNGVTKIAITDHNSVKGVERAINYSQGKNIEIVPGIEIDCTYKEVDFHILGYGIDYKDKCFLDIEENVLVQELNSTEDKIRKIQEGTDLFVDREKILNIANGNIVTGELIGEVILEDERNKDSELLKTYYEGGEKSDMPFVHFYWDFFSQGKVAYVKMDFPKLEDTIKIIKEKGGKAVLAHPGNNLKGKLEMLEDIIKEGIDGIEVYSSYHSDDQRNYFLRKAKENNLEATWGSDFHGKNKPKIKIGEI